MEKEKKEFWIDRRYIEIFESSAEEMEYVLEKSERQANQPWDNVIKVKGLPYKVLTYNLHTLPFLYHFFSFLPFFAFF